MEPANCPISVLKANGAQSRDRCRSIARLGFLPARQPLVFAHPASNGGSGIFHVAPMHMGVKSTDREADTSHGRGRWRASQPFLVFSLRPLVQRVAPGPAGDCSPSHTSMSNHEARLSGHLSLFQRLNHESSFMLELEPRFMARRTSRRELFPELDC